MKKLIYLFLIVLFGSCYSELKPIRNPEKITTIEIQSLPKDTVIISVDGSTIYVFDENLLVKNKIEILDIFKTIMVICSFCLFCIILIYIFIISFY